MDAAKNEGGFKNNEWAKEIEATQIQDTREQPWKEAVHSWEKTTGRTGVTSDKRSDLVEQGSHAVYLNTVCYLAEFSTALVNAYVVMFSILENEHSGEVLTSLERE